MKKFSNKISIAFHFSLIFSSLSLCRATCRVVSVWQLKVELMTSEKKNVIRALTWRESKRANFQLKFKWRERQVQLSQLSSPFFVIVCCLLFCTLNTLQPVPELYSTWSRALWTLSIAFRGDYQCFVVVESPSFFISWQRLCFYDNKDESSLSHSNSSTLGRIIMATDNKSTISHPHIVVVTSSSVLRSTRRCGWAAV